MKKSLATLAALAALSLSACGTEEVTAAAPAASPVAATQEATTPAFTPAPSSPLIFAFGETATCDNATQPYDITVSQPAGYNPGKYSLGDITGIAAKFEVTVANTGTAPLDASTVYTDVSSGGAEAAEQFDTEAGLEGPPSTPLLPGQSVTFSVGYDVLDVNTLVLSVEGYSLPCEAAIFTNVS